MPAGTPKVALFGGKILTPGGTQTFNAPGTFTVPVGITSVNITGKGSPGNPGNAGNAASPNVAAGSALGGGGGAGGKAFHRPYSPGPGCSVNPAPNLVNQPYEPYNPVGASTYGGRNALTPTVIPGGFCNSSFPGAGNAGSSGNPQAPGNPGSAGNAGTASTGLSRTFPGGAAGNGGAGGSGGSGGTGGNAGGGSLSNRAVWTRFTDYCGCYIICYAGWCYSVATAIYNGNLGYGGNGGGNAGNYRQGGGGAGSINPGTPGNSPGGNTGGPGGNCGGGLGGWQNPTGGGYAGVTRAGGGGGGGNISYEAYAGGGGGGGRGNAGNPGSPGNPGAAANPSTFNSVAVTAGASYPISVASPGGQVVISWNPQ